MLLTKQNAKQLRNTFAFRFASVSRFVSRKFSAKPARAYGFTLIELIVVIGIIIILFTIMIIAIDPIFQLEVARDRQRETHINAIYGALGDYRAREGDFPPCVSTSQEDVEECEEYIVPEFLSELPQDPDEECSYFVKKGPAGRIGLKAECAEAEDKITTGDWIEP